MLTRKPVAAGRFYPGQREELRREVNGYLEHGRARLKAHPVLEGEIWGVMLPHAGHVFCGQIIGDTLAGWDLPPCLIILCPNHTGHGRPLGVWPEGEWSTPLGEVQVDERLAQDILTAGGCFEPDVASHLGEHSIEVILPFLQEVAPKLKIVPISVGTRNPLLLKAAGHALATVLKANPEVGVVISSDMNHYESHETTLDKDELALAKACVADAAGLLDVTEHENISMCGAAPLAIALFAGRELGHSAVSVTAHDTSGPVSGDYDHTVGYAGLHLCRESA